MQIDKRRFSSIVKQDRKLKASATILLFALSGLALAEPAIPSAYRNIAKAVGVPEKILYAIALQESKLLLGEGFIKPWPWTLNVKGTPHRMSNSAETVERIRQAKASGINNIDVGLMQVNLKYHGQRFENLSDAVDPYNNIWIGATILKEEYERCKQDWWCAVGHYHSRTPERAKKYRGLVKAHWGRL